MPRAAGPSPVSYTHLDVYKRQLGTSTWQIQEITRDRVVVTPAPGRTARLPFWHGEGAGRDYGFSRTIARFTREIAAGLDVKRTEGRSAACLLYTSRCV